MRILVFGEILWDVFPQKKEIGGASLNFGAHMSKLGADVYMVSAIGKDILGQETYEYLSKFNLSTKYISLTDKPTGVCNVTVDENGSPSYDLRREVAYDYIKFSPADNEKYDAFYMGTLARRSDVSEETFKSIVQNNNFKEIFCDINIRQKYYNLNLIEESLKYATILKISRGT